MKKPKLPYNIWKNLTMVLLAGLLFMGCSVKKDEKKSKKRMVPEIFHVVIKQDVQSLDELIKTGVDLNSYDSDGYTPLMHTVRLQNPSLSEKLIRNGAKIYQPHKNNKDLTAFSMVDEDNKEMRRILGNEIKRYGSLIESLITDGKYLEALKVSQENYLPVDLKMPRSDKTALHLASISYSNEMADKKRMPDNSNFIEYMRYFVKSIDRQSNYLIDNEDDFRRIVETIKDTPLLDSIGNMYATYSRNVKPITVSQEDTSHMKWLTLKIKVLNLSNQSLPLDEPHRKIYIDTLRPQDVLQSKNKSWITLVKELLNGRDENQNAHKSQLIKEVLEDLLSKSKVDHIYLKASLELLSIWPHTLPKTECSFDNNMLMVLKSIERKTYEMKMIEQLTGVLSAFCPENSNNSEESIKFILTGDFKDSEKKTLLEVISKQSEYEGREHWRLPKEILAYTIENGGQDLFFLLIQSDVRFNPKEQVGAVFSALSHTESGDSANTILLSLSKRGVPFNTDNGVQAIHVAFDKMWRNKKSYQKPLELLLSINPLIYQSPSSLMEDKEIFNILHEHLKFIKNKRKGWSLMTKFLKSINWPIDWSRNYTIPIKDFSVLGLRNIRVSLVWDYILTMYDIYKTFPNELDSISNFISELVFKVPDDTISMAFVEYGSDLHPDKFLFQNTIPLSLILSINEKTIREALSVDVGEEYKINIEHRPPRLSWQIFMEGSVYKHYSAKPEFWEKISKILLRVNVDMNLNLPNDKSMVDFIKIMLYSGQFQKYPELVDILGRQQISLDDKERECLLDKQKIDVANLPKVTSVPVSNRATLSNNEPIRYEGEERMVYTGYYPVWTTIGVFEALRPLKNRSCDYKKISEKEIIFVDQFINNHSIIPIKMREQVFTGISLEDYPRSVVDCSHDYDVVTDYELSLNYSQLGIPLSKSELSKKSIPKFVVPSGECYMNELDKSAEDSAIRSFLNYWYRCAINTGDRQLVDYFKSIEDTFELNPQKKRLDEEVYVCKWKSL